jgi:hypothetical protein
MTVALSARSGLSNMEHSPKIIDCSQKKTRRVLIHLGGLSRGLSWPRGSGLRGETQCTNLRGGERFLAPELLNLHRDAVDGDLLAFDALSGSRRGGTSTSTVWLKNWMSAGI